MINDATVTITTPARCGKREWSLIFIDGTAAATHPQSRGSHPGWAPVPVQVSHRPSLVTLRLVVTPFAAS